MNQFDDTEGRPVALITGASRGLGAMLAKFLAESGYELILTARGADALRERADELSDETAVFTVAGDVTDPVHRDELVRVVDDVGELDLLVNNASALGPSPMPTLAEYPLDDLRRVFETNVVAPIALVQSLLPALRARDGLVVNVTSDAAVGGYPGWGGYGASKAALDLASATLSAELDDVGVVAVDPGDMRTDMHRRAFPGEDISDRPEPEATLPFWAWLFGHDPGEVDGRRFEAQADRWLEAA